MLYRRLSIIAYVVLFAGCTATTKDVVHLQNVQIPSDAKGEGAIVVFGLSADAKQRFIWGPEISVPVVTADGSRIDVTRRIICAEPSPDALSALSASVSAQVSAELQGKGSGSAAYQKAFSEAVQSIGKRTVTIQLLRDGLYRACEAYANGLLDEFSYGLILSKIDNLMVQLVAIENLGQGTAAPGDTTGAAQLKAAVVNEAAAVKAEQDYQIALQHQRETEERARQDRSAAVSATRQVTQIKGKQKAVDDQIEAEKKLIVEDEAAAKNALAAGNPAPPAKGDKKKLAGLEQQKIAFAGALASAEHAVTLTEAASESTATAAVTATQEAAAAKTAAAKARTLSIESEAVAANVKKILGPGATKAIVDVANKSHAASTMVSGCMIWFSRHPNVTVSGATDQANIGPICKEVIRIALEKMAGE